MLREVFYIADAGVQCRCGDRFAVNLNGAVCDIFDTCLLYTSDAADELDGVDLGGRRIIKKIFFQAEDGIRDS